MTTRAGARQFESKMMGATFMMLVADMALLWDPEYRRHVQHYDRHRRAFRDDAAKAWKKLTELGCGDLAEEAARKPSRQPVRRAR